MFWRNLQTKYRCKTENMNWFDHAVFTFSFSDVLSDEIYAYALSKTLTKVSSPATVGLYSSCQNRINMICKQMEGIQTLCFTQMCDSYQSVGGNLRKLDLKYYFGNKHKDWALGDLHESSDLRVYGVAFVFSVHSVCCETWLRVKLFCKTLQCDVQFFHWSSHWQQLCTFLVCESSLHNHRTGLWFNDLFTSDWLRVDMSLLCFVLLWGGISVPLSAHTSSAQNTMQGKVAHSSQLKVCSHALHISPKTLVPFSIYSK